MNTSSGQFLEPYLAHWLPVLYTSSYWWTLLGFGGNLLFSSRFLFQWIASERRRKLVVPSYFWQLSFWGSVINLVYALHIDNAPFLFGTLALPFIYGRNLVLLRRSKEPTQPKPVISAKPALQPRFGPA
jgi:lipid-A-disaccharide synthase-like uncharacterized protein